MFLLIGEATGLYDLLIDPRSEGAIVSLIGRQFHHHPWNGLRLWDLGLPFFLFISGVAMTVSAGRRCGERQGRGPGWGRALVRSGLLMVMGWALYAIVPVEGAPRGAFLYDVLPHLAVGGLIVFATRKARPAVQLAFSLGLLAITEALYRLWPIVGSDGPFSPGQNFGAYVDRALLGDLSDGHWVVINIIPAAAFMIWGSLAGRLLISRGEPGAKLKGLIAAGFAALATGLLLSFVTPIVRRICTSSFALITGGLGVLALALAFWTAARPVPPKIPRFFAPVGANPLFIYLFAQTGGAEWLRVIVAPFAGGCGALAGEWAGQALTSLAVWALLWALCFVLYRKKIFIRI
jgi:predicted acyltransferase